MALRAHATGTLYEPVLALVALPASGIVLINSARVRCTLFLAYLQGFRVDVVPNT